jgi:hypothetical protein
MSVGIIIRGKNNEPNKYRLTQKELDKYYPGLEDHNYKGFNRALGCEDKSKEHFVRLMEQGGFVPFEKGEKLAEEQRNRTKKEYKGVSEKTRRVISQLRSTADSNGKLSSREGTLRAMKDCGVNIEQLTKVPEKFRPDSQGFYELG